MLVPGHVVALFLATGGQNGPALGCDEKETVLLVYVIIDVATESVSLSLYFCFSSSSSSSSASFPRNYHRIVTDWQHEVVLPFRQ